MPHDKSEVDNYLAAAGFTGPSGAATPQPPAQSSAQPQEDEGASDIDKFLADFGLPENRKS